MPLNLIASFRIKFIKFSRKKATSEIVVGGMISIGLFFYFIHPADTTNTLALHIGKPYEAVVRDSTFPVNAQTAMYRNGRVEADSTWIDRPTIVKFDDPQHGFTLPATKFGAVGYKEDRVLTLTTSPMLETLSFDQLVLLLTHLQTMFKTAGWVPQNEHDHAWLNLDTEAERKDLQRLLFKKVAISLLVVPHKYILALNVKCYGRCGEHNPETAKYLIDISMGPDRLKN